MVDGENNKFVGHIVCKLCSVAGIREEGTEVDGTRNVICFGVEVVFRSLTNGFAYAFGKRLLWADAASVLDMDLAVQNILHFEVIGGFELAEVSLQSNVGRHDGNVSFS